MIKEIITKKQKLITKKAVLSILHIFLVEQCFFQIKYLLFFNLH